MSNVVYLTQPDGSIQRVETVPAESVRAAKPESPRIELISPPADILTREIPSREYVCGPYGALHATTSFLGEGGVGKSKFVRMLMLHAAAGLPFLNHATVAGRYVYLSAEDEQQEVWRDVQRIARSLPAESRALALKNFSLIDAVGRGLYFVASKDGMAKISATVDHIAEAVGKARMICVDTLSRVNGSEENSNATMAVIEAACSRLAQKTGASVWITHHVAKAAAREQIADLHSGRGGSALGDNARGVLRLMPASPTDCKGFTDVSPLDVERGDILRLIHAKNSYGRKADQVWLRRTPEGLLEQFTPERQSTADVAETMLQEFVQWWDRNRRMPFTRSSVTRNASNRGRLEEIWPRGVSKAGAAAFFKMQLDNHTFLPALEKVKGGDGFVMNTTTADALLSKAAAAALAAELEFDDGSTP